MIGMRLRDPRSRVTGIVDAVTVHPDGKALVRINDHWLFAEGRSGLRRSGSAGPIDLLGSAPAA